MALEGTQQLDQKNKSSLGFLEENSFIIRHAPSMHKLCRLVESTLDTDLTVLLSGESGVGKELFSKILHDHGPRKAFPFVVASMTTTPHNMIMADLFGYEKGVLPYADTRSLGRIGQAQNGTLFIKEISEMPLDVQASFLRLFQSGTYLTVGGMHPVPANVRIIASTSRDLRWMVQKGVFREELLNYLFVVHMRVPPLRQRLEDIDGLVQMFLECIHKEGLPLKTLNTKAVDLLKNYVWPGNVRSFGNLMRALVVSCHHEVITESDVAEELKNRHATHLAQQNMNNTSLANEVGYYLDKYFSMHGEGFLPPNGVYDRIMREIERPLIEKSLQATGGNQVKAAALLGINRNTLRKKINALGISLK